VPGATVCLVPSEEPLPRLSFKSVKTDLLGHFRLTGVPPGSYKLFAWDDVDTNQVAFDPDFLRPYGPVAQNIEISENQKVSVQLKLIKALTGQ